MIDHACIGQLWYHYSLGRRQFIHNLVILNTGTDQILSELQISLQVLQHSEALNRSKMSNLINICTGMFSGRYSTKSIALYTPCIVKHWWNSKLSPRPVAKSPRDFMLREDVCYLQRTGMTRFSTLLVIGQKSERVTERVLMWSIGITATRTSEFVCSVFELAPNDLFWTGQNPWVKYQPRSGTTV